MFVTETDDIWVTANFKETQLARMHRGENVTIHVDTFGRNYRGYVAHMPGASGDRFSLLPPENATGNYVKVVQRLPVRIVFEPREDADHQLHPGMSVESTVWLQQSHSTLLPIGKLQSSRPRIRLVLADGRPVLVSTSVIVLNGTKAGSLIYFR
jgi:multidrug resistance efflux pump